MKLSIAGMVVFLAGVSAVPALGAADKPLPARDVAAAAGQNRSERAIPAGQPASAWWGDRDAGWIGGVGGGVIGSLGALIGVLGGLGKARRFVVALTTTLIAVGALGMIVGLIALTLSQPYAVWYPLLLGGIILTTVCGGESPGPSPPLPAGRTSQDGVNGCKMIATPPHPL
jgi:hypothetical protein